MMTRSLIALVVALLVVGPVAAQGEDRPSRVARIIIEGNTATPDDVVLSFFELRPGQIMMPHALRDAEQRLRECGLFRVNRWRGVGPTVEILPNDFGTEFLDIRIAVEERPWNHIAFPAVELIEAALAGDLENLHDAAHRLWRALASRAP